MEYLPDEVLLCVFSFLNLEDICKCSLVCKRWSAICKDRSLWRAIDLDLHPNPDWPEQASLFPDEILSKIAKIHPCVQSISFRYCRGVSGYNAVVYVIDKSLEMFENIKSFSMEGTPLYQFDWTSVIRVCGHTLTEFRMEGNESFGGALFPLLFKNRDLRLQKLSLAHCGHLTGMYMYDSHFFDYDTFKLNLGLLQELNLDGISDMSDASLAKFFTATPMLKSLTIDGEEISDSTPQNVADMLPLLEHFSISFCTNLTDASLLSITRLCHLESLHFKKNRLFTSVGFQQIAHRKPTHLPSGKEVGIFKRFSAIECSGFDNLALTCLAENCPELKYVDLSWCWPLTDSGLHSLSIHCRKIQVLKIVGLKFCTCVHILDNPMPLLRVFDAQQSDSLDDSRLMQLKAAKPWIEITDYWGNSVCAADT